MQGNDLYRYTGNESQLFGVRRLQSTEGRTGGCGVIQIHTAGGLDVEVLPDNGMDLGLVRYKGVNMSFMSKNGYDSPSSFQPFEEEFLRYFPGGMLCTCGLRSVGPANRDGGEWFPLHGRIHGQQAAQVNACVEGDNILVSGVLQESALFGHRLRLRRRITVPVWGSSITVEDTIENLAPAAQEIMLLYHYNFGYPMLSEQARLVLPAGTKTTTRDANAEKGLGKELSFTKPIDNEPEQVFFHETNKGEARLENPALGFAATLDWNQDSLPVFAQWKSMGSGDYVLGLEPANCFIMGRSEERANGTLQTLDGFASLQTKTQLTFEEM